MVVIDIEPIRERVSAAASFLDERGRRLVAAAEAFAAGYGGIAAVAMATGIAPNTIGRALKKLAWDEPSQRIRWSEAGRKPTISKDTTLLHDLEAWLSRRRGVIPNRPLHGIGRKAAGDLRRRQKRNWSAISATTGANIAPRQPRRGPGP